LSTATPIPVSAAAAAGIGTSPTLTFCGIAADKRDHLYVVDDEQSLLLGFDREGKAVSRWPLPEGYAPVKGCLAADAQHIYLLSNLGMVSIFDYDGTLSNQIKLPFLPAGIAPDGGGGLVALEPAQISRVDVATGQVSSFPMPPTDRRLRVAYGSIMITSRGEILATNSADNQIVRLALSNGEVLDVIGSEGPWPGQFVGLGSLAEDRSGYIYASDWRVGVIQRFAPDGAVDRVWWARTDPQPTPILEEEY
jgi:streptogramin lyase